MTTPVYIAVSDDLKKKIINGEYPLGSKLLPERKLCKLYNVSRTTLRQAINNLAVEGYVYSVKGSGTFVAEKRIVKQKNKLTSFTEDIKSKGFMPKTNIISFEKILPSEIMAERLGISKTEQIFRLERIRMANDIPVLYEVTYRPVKYSPDLKKVDLNNSLFEKLERENVKISYSEQTIEAVLSIDRTSKLLDIAKNSPLLVIKSKLYLEDNTLFEYSRNYYRADMYKAKHIVTR